jgi:hypothetical protein
MMKTPQFILAIFIIWLQGCTSANIRPLTTPSEENAATIIVYRASAFNQGAVPSIISIDGVDVASLYNTSYSEIRVAFGQHVLAVRSNQADKGDTADISIRKNQVLIFEIYANPNNYAKTLVPIAFFFGKSFLLKEIENGDREKIRNNYEYIPVTYN